MTSHPPSFDLAAAHRWFAASYFNQTWDLIDRPTRSPEEDELMISTCHASLCHWRQRDDCQRVNLSVGYWQAARVYTLAQRPDDARRYAELCLAHSTGEGAFYEGYAHEALARAARLSGDDAACRVHLGAARQLAAQIEDADSRGVLEADLHSIG